MNLNNLEIILINIGNEDIGFSTALSKLEGLQEGLYYVNRMNSQKVNLRFVIYQNTIKQG